MACSKLKVVLFLGSVRPNRMAERVRIAFVEAIKANGMEPILLGIIPDPAELPFEIVKTPLEFMKNPDEAPAWLKEVNEKIKTTDAFLIASCEYNSSMPPALTNMMDHFPSVSYRNRPCGILSYSPGPFGGIRVGTLLRIFVAEFGMFPVPSSVAIPTVHESISPEGRVNQDTISRDIVQQLEELCWHATAVKKHAAVTPPPS